MREDHLDKSDNLGKNLSTKERFRLLDEYLKSTENKDVSLSPVDWKLIPEIKPKQIVPHSDFYQEYTTFKNAWSEAFHEFKWTYLWIGEKTFDLNAPWNKALIEIAQFLSDNVALIEQVTLVIENNESQNASLMLPKANLESFFFSSERQKKSLQVRIDDEQLVIASKRGHQINKNKIQGLEL